MVCNVNIRVLLCWIWYWKIFTLLIWLYSYSLNYLNQWHHVQYGICQVLYTPTWCKSHACRKQPVFSLSYSKWCYEVKWNSEKPTVNSIFKGRIFNCPSKLLYQGTFHGLADNRCMSPSQTFSAQPQLDWTKDYSCIDPRPYPSSDLGKINDWAVTPCIHSGRVLDIEVQQIALWATTLQGQKCGKQM